MNWTDKIQVFNEDCMETMARYEDNYFDLAVVDPPYGMNADIKNNGKHSNTHEKTSLAKINKYHLTNWDKNIPNQDYFKELNRVSKKQIIWGANYFGLIGGMLYWHKGVTMPTYSKGELAYLSWVNKIDFVEITWHGMLQYNMKDKEERIHPTQKPVALYQWIYQNYAKEGFKILDTHFGSGSNGIAIDNINKIEKLNLSLVACEIDNDYYSASKKRFEQKTAWSSLFV
jgi:site-specific DNA-methyltransferase (adenine-specific)